MIDQFNALVLNPLDQVGVALQELKVGDEGIYNLNSITNQIKVVEDIPIYHKFSLVNIKKGDLVRKYGQVIGRATHPIKIGEHVHEHNLASTLEAKEEG